MHTLLRELRKLREEMGDEDDPCKTEPTEQDPLHLPLSRYSGGGSGWGSTKAGDTEPPPQPSPGVPGDGVSDVRVTGEQSNTHAIRKTEPTDERKPLLSLEKQPREEAG